MVTIKRIINKKRTIKIVIFPLDTAIIIIKNTQTKKELVSDMEKPSSNDDNV